MSDFTDKVLALSHATREAEEAAVRTARETAARRAALELLQWRGHLERPAGRLAERRQTFRAIVEHVVTAIARGDDEMASRVLAEILK